jgi:hypothetical protein
VWSAQPTALLTLPRTVTFPDRELDVLISSKFDMIIDIFITGQPSQIISEVVMSISDARTHLPAENNLLILAGADFDSTPQITRTADADKLLKDANIDPLEAARIEGHIKYGVASQAFASTFAQQSEISLATVFPAVNFGKTIKLAILNRGEALGIIPTETVTVNSSARCDCSEGPDFKVTRTTITNTAPANPGPNDEVGQITIGGPVPDNKDPLGDFGPRHPDSDGMVGLYIPHEFSEALTVEAMPSIKLVASDDGFIGFRAEANVGFKNLSVSFDQAGGGILLDIDLDISISAYCDMQLFKGIRVPIGWAVVMPSQEVMRAFNLASTPRSMVPAP